MVKLDMRTKRAKPISNEKPKYNSELANLWLTGSESNVINYADNGR